VKGKKRKKRGREGGGGGSPEGRGEYPSYRKGDLRKFLDGGIRSKGGKENVICWRKKEKD